MNRSIAAISGAWFRRKTRHPWLGGPRRLTMYLATLDCATSNPSLSSSPWMRGAPRAGSRCSSAGSTRGGPFRSAAALPVSATSNANTAKARPMPTHQRLGTDDREDLQNRRKRSIQLDKEPAIAVREPGSATHLAPQNDQLMSECRILRRKPAPRLERRGQDTRKKHSSANILL